MKAKFEPMSPDRIRRIATKAITGSVRAQKLRESEIAEFTMNDAKVFILAEIAAQLMVLNSHLEKVAIHVEGWTEA